MNRRKILRTLVSKLRQREPHGTVVFVPNFSLDVRLSSDLGLSSIIARMKQVDRNRGGVVYAGFEGEVALGGASAITARAISTLGARSCFIGQTNQFGLMMLKELMSDSGTRIIVDKVDTLNLTFILELVKKRRSRSSNLMFSDAGPIFSSPTREEIVAVKAARILAIQDYWWCIDPRAVLQLFEISRASGSVNFLDTGDPTEFRNRYRELFKLLASGLVDILGLNENESTQYATYLVGRRVSSPLVAAQILGARFNIDIDLHTANYSFTMGPSCKAVMPCFRVGSIRRETGAGDHWTAGSLYGRLIGLGPEERLLFANAVAAYYVVNKYPAPPKLTDALRLLRGRPLQEIKGTLHV